MHLATILALCATITVVLCNPLRNNVSPWAAGINDNYTDYYNTQYAYRNGQNAKDYNSNYINPWAAGINDNYTDYYNTQYAYRNGQNAKDYNSNNLNPGSASFNDRYSDYYNPQYENRNGPDAKGFNSNNMNQWSGEGVRHTNDFNSEFEARNGPKINFVRNLIPQYNIAHGVHDPHTHDIKSQFEDRSGLLVTGGWQLEDPDGTQRRVTYRVTGPTSGLEAFVERKGIAHHPNGATSYVAGPSYWGIQTNDVPTSGTVVVDV